MSAQTAGAKPTVEPVTPVIVKVGGDLDYGSEKPGIGNPVTIESSELAFVATVPGFIWASSQSREPGRIIRLTILDGPDKKEVPVDPTSELASVTMRFGPARLIAMETGVAAHNEVFLLFTSPEVPFHAGRHGDWTESGTMFPNNIKSVTLTVGDTQKLNYDFQTDAPTLQIDFDLNSPN